MSASGSEPEEEDSGNAVRPRTEFDDSWLVPDDVIIVSGESDSDAEPDQPVYDVSDDGSGDDPKELVQPELSDSESDESPIRPKKPEPKNRIQEVRKPEVFPEIRKPTGKAYVPKTVLQSISSDLSCPT